MSICIEFYGVARQRAGTAEVQLELAVPCPLRDVLVALAERFPALADECIEQDRLGAGYVVNLDGRQFVHAPEVIIQDGQSVLLMSADAGG